MSTLIPFTFNLPVTGLSNPFLLQQQKERQQQLQQQQQQKLQQRREKKPRLPPRPAPPEDTFSPSVLKKRRRSVSPMPIVAPSPRSRGWTPTMGEPSCATTTTTGSYRGASSNYEEMREAGWENAQYGREEQDIIEELPPAKRRRTFAGSIVSTAISAALIGTAVGITVYRLWRDRGKKRNEPQLEEPHHMMPPPPPYQEKEDSPLTTAVPITATAAVTPALEQEPQAKVTPATPRSVRRGRHAHTSSVSKRTAIERQRRSVRHRQQAANASASPPQSTSPGRTSFSLPQDFDAEMDDEEGDGDQMDWIGDKVSSLLEEAKRALGREIVVMSDAKEDEVDDGSGAWVEDDDDMMPSTTASAGPSRSRPGSIRRRHRPRDIAVHASPSMAAHNNQASPRSFGAAASVESLGMPQALAPAKEDSSSWESPEMRELMERARAKYLANRS